MHGHEESDVPVGNRERMEAILNYWLEHNGEHQREQEKWLRKTEELGFIGVAEELRKAVELFSKAAHHVELAKARLGELH